jgi:hypothetical protein
MLHRLQHEGHRLKRLVAMMAGGALLGGCVTNYPMPAVIGASAAMTEEAALTIVRSQLIDTDKRAGFCLHFVYPPAVQAVGDLVLQPLILNGAVVELSYEPTTISQDADNIIRSTLVRTGRKRNEVERARYSVHFDLTSVAFVTIGEKASMATCKGKPGSIHVELVSPGQSMRQHRLAFELAPANLDMFLAAVKRLSPRLSITQ